MLVVTNVRTSASLELDIPVDTLIPQDSGAREAAQVAFDLYDPAISFDMLPEDELVVSTVEDPTVPLVNCNVRVLGNDVDAIGRIWHITAYDASTLLDRVNVVQDDRPAGESDKTRLHYFMTTYGTGVGLDDDPAGIATLNASMPAQKFRLITLRQAIEQVLGSALSTGTYRLNAYKKLETWDTASGLAAAPFNVIVGTPGAGQIAPEKLVIQADTSNLYNAYWVRGATAAGSGWFTDPTSIAQWGRREKYIDAPDSDLAWKAFNVGHAALADTAQPLYRGTFTDTSPHDGWRSNQRFLLTSPQHDLVAAPFDTVRVTPHFLSGTAKQQYDIEFGSPKNSFTAKHGKEARRISGTGPGSGGWGPGGGFGGGGVGGAGGVVDCGCPPFAPCPFTVYDDMNRTNGSAWGNASSGPTWIGTAINHPTLVDSIAPTQGRMRLSSTSVGPNNSGSAEERIAGPGFWSSSSDWAMKTSIQFINNTVSAWTLQFGEDTVAWSRPGFGSGAILLVGGNFGSLPAGVFDSFGIVAVTVRRAGSTITATVGAIQVSGPVNSPGADDLVFNFGGVGGAPSGVGGSEILFGPISVATCGDAPATGQPFENTAIGDGSTTSYTADFPFGAVRKVIASGVDVTSDVTQTDAVTFAFGHAPPNGAEITATLEGA